MVHQDVARFRLRILAVSDLVFRCHRRDLFVGSRQADEGRIERGNEARELLHGVVRGVHGDEQHLHVFRLIAEAFHHLVELHQSRGADIWAMCVAEKHDHDLAAEIRGPGRLAGMRGECEIPTPFHAADVGGFERRRRRAGRDEQRQQEKEKPIS